MKGKEFKEWAMQVPDAAEIEVKRYDWDALEPEKIRAILICAPKISTESLQEESAS